MNIAEKPEKPEEEEKQVALIETNDGWDMKVYIAYLAANVTTATFHIDFSKKSITSEILDVKNTTAIRTELKNFRTFVYAPEWLNPIQQSTSDDDKHDNTKPNTIFKAGFTTKVFNEAIKAIKKKQMLSLSIVKYMHEGQFAYKMGVSIKTHFKEDVPIITNYIPLETFDTYVIEVPKLTDYKYIVNGNKQELNNIINNSKKFGDLITIYGQANGLLFVGSTNELNTSSTAKVGNWNRDAETVYTATFTTSQFEKMKKCNAFTMKSFNVHFTTGNLLLFVFNFSEIGETHIYLAEYSNEDDDTKHPNIQPPLTSSSSSSSTQTKKKSLKNNQLLV